MVIYKIDRRGEGPWEGGSNNRSLGRTQDVFNTDIFSVTKAINAQVTFAKKPQIKMIFFEKKSWISII